MIDRVNCSILSYVSVCKSISVNSSKASGESTNEGVGSVIDIGGKSLTPGKHPVEENC